MQKIWQRVARILRDVGWIYTIFVLALLTAHASLLPTNQRSFVVGSAAAGGLALIIPWLMGKPLAWATVVAALLFQLDLGSAFQTDFTVCYDCAPNSSPPICPIPKSPRSLARVGIPLATLPPAELSSAEYRTAVDEIRRRTDHEQALFLVKLGICAAVLAAVFRLLQQIRPSANEPHPEWHDSPNMKDRAIRAVGNWVLGYSFFWAAALSSAIIDSRLRFNARMIETLGCWIYLFEAPSKMLYWETYLRADGVFFQPPMYALLRIFPNNLVTILLFTGIVYFSLIMDPHPKGMARWCGAAAVLLFASTCASYHGDSGAWLIHCSIWLAVSLLGIAKGSRTLRSLRIRLR
jgi:hypothetical protein